MREYSMEVDDAADLMPELNEAKLAELVKDIRENGLIESIWTCDGKILDGRHRLKACEITGVEPTFREWSKKGSKVNFVLSLNLHRRHLEVGQLAAIAVKAKNMLEKEIAEESRDKHVEGGKAAGKGRRKLFGNNSKELRAPRNAREEAAKAVGVNPRYVSDAERIQEASPEVFEQVKAGTKTIPEAKREVGLTPPKPTGKCRVNGELVDDPSDIAEQRASGKLPKNGVIDIDDPKDKTDIASIQEEYVERAAIQNDLSDEDWLKTLPLAKQLQGKPLDIFKDHAVLWRNIEPYRRAFADGIASLTKKNRKRIGYVYRVHSFVGTKNPKNWSMCPPLTDGGCAGNGDIPIIVGECPKCRSAGFLTT